MRTVVANCTKHSVVTFIWVQSISIFTCRDECTSHNITRWCDDTGDTLYSTALHRIIPGYIMIQCRTVLIISQSTYPFLSYAPQTNRDHYTRSDLRIDWKLTANFCGLLEITSFESPSGCSKQGDGGWPLSPWHDIFEITCTRSLKSPLWHITTTVLHTVS